MKLTCPDPPFRLDFHHTDPLRRSIGLLAQPLLERLLHFPTLNGIYERTMQRDARLSFCERALAEMGVTIDVCERDLQQIPRTGPLVVVANHPFGGLEGMILLAVLQRVRPDARLMGNYLLGRIPEMRPDVFFVDPFGGSDAATRNIAALRAALRWVAGGGALGVFPAGEVSHLTLGNRCVTDPPWSPMIARLIRQTGAAVVPVFFDGHNSAVFQLAGLIHPRLRTVLLPRELINKSHRTVSLRVGSAIPPEKLARFDNPDEMTAYLRVRTYILKGRSAGGTAHRTPGSTNSRRDAELPPAQPVDALLREIGALSSSQCLLRSGPFEVWHATAGQIPRTLLEIGRLRELTFRLVGEGTGRERDLDRFDDYYVHLFLWNREEQHLCGAYRLGATDEILPRFGIDGLYTSTLFRYRPRLLQLLGPSLEAGRSFVLADYQKSYSALTLLWKGIGRYVAANPRYRMLFGAVSISDDYQSMTKQILMAFLQHNDYRSDLGRLVRPLRPPHFRRFRDCGRRPLAAVVRSVDDVDELVAEIETERRNIPVLLRQYLRLNGKLLGFNIDPDFGDVLDGLLLVDLTDVDRLILDRYLGREGAAAFLALHGKSSSAERPQTAAAE